jgi:hypothetical protein
MGEHRYGTFESWHCTALRGDCKTKSAVFCRRTVYRYSSFVLVNSHTVRQTSATDFNVGSIIVRIDTNIVYSLILVHGLAEGCTAQINAVVVVHRAGNRQPRGRHASGVRIARLCVIGRRIVYGW